MSVETPRGVASQAMSSPAGSPADHRYVALTTFRRSGDPVTCPVWIVEMDDDHVGVTTEGGTGKVKRLRNDDRVELRPSDGRGKVPADAPTWTGTATVVTGAEAEQVHQAVRDKYGFQMTLVQAAAKLRRSKGERVGLVISLAE